jgi:hypothetical protein
MYSAPIVRITMTHAKDTEDMFREIADLTLDQALSHWLLACRHSARADNLEYDDATRAAHATRAKRSAAAARDHEHTARLHAAFIADNTFAEYERCKEELFDIWTGSAERLS